MGTNRTRATERRRDRRPRVRKGRSSRDCVSIISATLRGRRSSDCRCIELPVVQDMCGLQVPTRKVGGICGSWRAMHPPMCRRLRSLLPVPSLPWWRNRTRRDRRPSLRLQETRLKLMSPRQERLRKPPAREPRMQEARPKPTKPHEAPVVEAAAAQAGSQDAIAVPAGAAAGSPATRAETRDAEASNFGYLLRRSLGLSLFRRGGALLFLKRRKAKETPQSQGFVAVPHRAVNIEALMAAAIREPETQAIAGPHHAVHVDAPMVPSIGEPATERDANSFSQAIAMEDADLGEPRCSACGHGLQLVARFCSNCGMPVARQN